MVTAEDRQRLRREKTREAINLALQSRWEEAAEANRAVLTYFPDDVEAHARLGKALMEMGQIDAARSSLDEALKRDPHNQIVRRNMERLKTMKPARPGGNHRPSRRLDPQFFIEQSGKSTITALSNLAPPAVVVDTSAGDPVNLRVVEGRLVAETADGVYVGRVETRLAARLVPLMHGGNRYEAAVVAAEDSALSIIIREVFQHPSQSHIPSFPIKGGEEHREPFAEAPAASEESEEADEEEGEEEAEDQEWGQAVDEEEVAVDEEAEGGYVSEGEAEDEDGEEEGKSKDVAQP